MVQKVVEVGPADVKDFTSVGTYLSVKKWRHVIPFFRMSGRVEQQLKRTEGVVRYGLKTDFLHKRFWTYSVWKDRQAIGPFVRSEPHATAVKKFAEWAGEVRPLLSGTIRMGKSIGRKLTADSRTRRFTTDDRLVATSVEEFLTNPPTSQITKERAPTQNAGIDLEPKEMSVRN